MRTETTNATWVYGHEDVREAAKVMSGNEETKHETTGKIKNTVSAKLKKKEKKKKKKKKKPTNETQEEDDDADFVDVSDCENNSIDVGQPRITKELLTVGKRVRVQLPHWQKSHRGVVQALHSDGTVDLTLTKGRQLHKVPITQMLMTPRASTDAINKKTADATAAAAAVAELADETTGDHHDDVVENEDWDQYEISEKEITSIFESAFYVFDKNSAGYLNVEQFGSMMHAFAKDCQSRVTIAPGELCAFMDILDNNKSGNIHQEDFVSVSLSDGEKHLVYDHWKTVSSPSDPTPRPAPRPKKNQRNLIIPQFFFDLAWITPKDRADFIKRGPMFAKLAQIVEGEMAQLKKWAYVVHTFFLRHVSARHISATGLPDIGPDELGDLIVEVQGIVDNPSEDQLLRPSAEELARFVKFMDKDQDGWVDEQELICFCVQGLRQTPQEHFAFAQRSPMHAKLIRFIEAINSVSRGDLKHLLQRLPARKEKGEEEKGEEEVPSVQRNRDNAEEEVPVQLKPNNAHDSHASLFCTYTEEEVVASGGKYDCAECGSSSRALRLDVDDEGGIALYCEPCWIRHYGETFDGVPPTSNSDGGDSAAVETVPGPKKRELFMM
jgi:Ca2+-binding EF-hand superfamily protein